MSARARIPSLRDIRDFDQAFDRAFSLIAFVMNRHLVDHMLRTARLVADGDIESLLLLGVLAHQNAAHLMPPGTCPSAVLNEAGRIREFEQRVQPMMLRDLSAISGIPRETARRKLEKLLAAGFVERSGRAWVVSVKRIEPELRQHTRESVWRMLAAADEIRALLRQTDAAEQDTPQMPAGQRFG